MQTHCPLVQSTLFFLSTLVLMVPGGGGPAGVQQLLPSAVFLPCVGMRADILGRLQRAVTMDMLLSTGNKMEDLELIVSR